jgi:putative SOS response-associated peptidase YedK
MLKEQIPMFFAGHAEVHSGLEPDDRDGFVIFTAASDEGMVDIHDRKPLVLAPEHAREWIDQETTLARARDIAIEHCRPADDFHWYNSQQRGRKCPQSRSAIDRTVVPALGPR